jgi:hypothetical protein
MLRYSGSEEGGGGRTDGPVDAVSEELSDDLCRSLQGDNVLGGLGSRLMREEALWMDA